MAETDTIVTGEPLSPHALTGDETCRLLHTPPEGLASEEAARRVEQFGHNRLPRAKSAGPALIFLRQFANPLIYILLFATLLSAFIGEWTDAGFILFVLLVNAVIGAVQEYQAQRSAEALQKLVSLEAVVVRGGIPESIAAEHLVPGDIVLIESGNKVPADLRLLQTQDLEIDESLLTGESLADTKDSNAIYATTVPVADRANMAFAGTMVLRGRGRGVVVATAARTELGKIASDVETAERAVPPLMLRMKTFTAWVAIAYVLVVSGIGLAAWLQGQAFVSILLIAVALAVAAIPEGLPVAITVSLAVGLSRMARDNVIIRRLVAAEALGSCTLIACDKTGTLTVNQLTVRRIQLPDGSAYDVSGEGTVLEGEIHPVDSAGAGVDRQAVLQLAQAAVFCNEANMYHRQTGWQFRGDTVDIALLVLGWKASVQQDALLRENPLQVQIPFESERMFSASLHALQGGGYRLSVKGAVEKIIAMCDRMLIAGSEQQIDGERIVQQAEELAHSGYRVLALAGKSMTVSLPSLDEHDLDKMCFLGLVGMMDPPRPEAREAIAECRRAGVSVVMITGDHPITAMAIARQLNLADETSSVITGEDLRRAKQQSATDFSKLMRGASIFARIDPHQKLQIVNELQGAGHFVAVTGDGANDAPALRAAHVGVSMGKRGTDVARESSEIIITDDNLASLVAGIREGRIAYANVRKVIFLLISTGAVEIVAFILALLAGLPLPLTAVQLLWLNLVTEGIQDVALAFEPGEGDEMRKPPRPPQQAIFDRLMIERLLISALTMGVLAFLVFWYQYSVAGASLEASRNVALLFLVMFENIQVLNSRSETVSILRQPFLNNRLLIVGTLAAQAIHILAMHTPGLSNVLDVQPVSINQWLLLLVTAMSMLLMMELHKWQWAQRPTANHPV